MKQIMGIIQRSLVLAALVAILSIQPGHAGATVATEQGNRAFANQADLVGSQAELSVGRAPDSKADARTPRRRRVPPFARLPRRQSSAQSFAPGDGYWDEWIGIPGLDYEVYSLAAIGNSVYAGGQTAIADPYASAPGFVDRWEGVGWSRLEMFGDGVYALAADGSNLYVGGAFPWLNHIAKWDGHQWSSLGSGVDGEVWALAVSGSRLYVGGVFSHAGGVRARNIAVWDNKTRRWSAVGGGVDDWVGTLAVDGNDLYVGGGFTQAINAAQVNQSAAFVTVNGIAKWNGRWSALGSGVTYMGCSPSCPWVNMIMVSKSRVYVGGWFDTAGGVNANGIAEWTKASRHWSALGTGQSNGFDGGAIGMAMSGDALYVAGYYDYAGGAPATNIARWDVKARQWSALGSGVGGWGCGEVLGALAISVMLMGNDVYVGGCFDQAGDMWSNNIALWHSSASLTPKHDASR
jgi:hypothetical protein